MSKTNIVIPDQYEPFYIHEKITNPNAKLYWAQFKRGDVEAVDHLVRLSHGKRETVSSQNDWKVLEDVFEYFARRWPHEYKDFKDAIPQIRESRNAGGYSKSKEIMHLGSLPPRFEKFIKAIFPLQKMNKEFMYKLVKRFPLFRIAKEGN